MSAIIVFVCYHGGWALHWLAKRIFRAKANDAAEEMVPPMYGPYQATFAWKFHLLAQYLRRFANRLANRKIDIPPNWYKV